MAKEIVTGKDVEDVATLSRLEFNETEIDGFKKDLNELKKAKLNAKQVHSVKPSDELKDYVKEEGTK